MTLVKILDFAHTIFGTVNKLHLLIFNNQSRVDKGEGMKEKIYIVHVITESTDHYYFAFSKKPSYSKIKALMGDEADYISSIHIEQVNVDAT
jgi:hypothetical protein